mmetsp:Transcript_36271/g.107767  ORF Transcript_36271/g.107767 Transcript_36271/m.107767 type:complete len:258 (+) Transcript_36271:841-1614(+)
MSAGVQPSSFATASRSAAWWRVCGPSLGSSPRELSLSSMSLEQITGCRSFSVLGANALRSSALQRWMARFGMSISGFGMRTSFSESWASPWRTTTLPARPSGLSNHVCQRPPPYVWMPTCSMPAEATLEFGRSRRQGESVWAPTMDTPEPLSTENLPPTTKAITSAPPLVTKYFPPFWMDHCLPSASSTKPLARSSFAQADTVWYGEPVSFAKSMNILAASIKLFLPPAMAASRGPTGSLVQPISPSSHVRIVPSLS